jgi:hypothetical protein
VREFLCSTIAAFGGLLFGIALSILLFSTVQLLRLPMSVAVSAFICLHFIIVYIADRNNKVYRTLNPNQRINSYHP